MARAPKEHKPFDYQVTKKDKKGRIVSHVPYLMVVENGVRRIEKPKGSGQWFDESGAPLKVK